MIIISQLFRGKNRKIWLSAPLQSCRCRKAALKKQQGKPCCFSNRTDLTVCLITPSVLSLRFLQES